MHGAPDAPGPWLFLCCVKGIGHVLMYAWHQISLILIYTALQSRSGCNRSLFMHALRSRHPSASAVGCGSLAAVAICGKEMVQRHFPTPKKGGSLDCALPAISERCKALGQHVGHGCGCNLTFVGDMWDMSAVVTAPFPDDRKCSTTTHIQKVL